MTVLNRKNRDLVRRLLDAHADATRAMEKAASKKYDCCVSVNEDSGNDYEAVDIDRKTARKLLAQHKLEIEGKLKKLGVTVG